MTIHHHNHQSLKKNQSARQVKPVSREQGGQHRSVHPATSSQELSAAKILALQKSVGNQAVSSLLGNKVPGDSTGLPVALKTSLERISGVSLDEVRVHYNSPEPKSVDALAFTSGADIYLQPGQEHHLPHEAWHVIQQIQGRVAPTMQMKNAAINADSKLETEADTMGEKAVQMSRQGADHGKNCNCPTCRPQTVQQTKPVTFLPAASMRQSGAALPGASMGVIQRRCSICGSDKHKTQRCPQSKQDRDEHQEQVKAFHAAKRETLSRMSAQEESSSSGRGATKAFREKHVKESGKTLDASSRRVAETRKWGGGSESGRSTVVDISPEDLQKEARFQIESLKLGEADMSEDSVAPRMGVNKPTKFDYRTVSSSVQADSTGKRTIQEEEPVLAKPVLGLKGQDVHHLHGVDDTQ